MALPPLAGVEAGPVVARRDLGRVPGWRPWAGGLRRVAPDRGNPHGGRAAASKESHSGGDPDDCRSGFGDGGLVDESVALWWSTLLPVVVHRLSDDEWGHVAGSENCDPTLVCAGDGGVYALFSC
jgi:hypothetical protein